MNRSSAHRIKISIKSTASDINEAPMELNDERVPQPTRKLPMMTDQQFKDVTTYLEDIKEDVNDKFLTLQADQNGFKAELRDELEQIKLDCQTAAEPDKVQEALDWAYDTTEIRITLSGVMDRVFKEIDQTMDDTINKLEKRLGHMAKIKEICNEKSSAEERQKLVRRAVIEAQAESRQRKELEKEERMAKKAQEDADKAKLDAERAKNIKSRLTFPPAPTRSIKKSKNVLSGRKTPKIKNITIKSIRLRRQEKVIRQRMLERLQAKKNRRSKPSLLIQCRPNQDRRVVMISPSKSQQGHRRKRRHSDNEIAMDFKRGYVTPEKDERIPPFVSFPSFIPTTMNNRVMFPQLQNIHYEPMTTWRTVPQYPGMVKEPEVDLEALNIALTPSRQAHAFLKIFKPTKKHSTKNQERSVKSLGDSWKKISMDNPQ